MEKHALMLYVQRALCEKLDHIFWPLKPNRIYYVDWKKWYNIFCFLWIVVGLFFYHFIGLNVCSTIIPCQGYCWTFPLGAIFDYVCFCCQRNITWIEIERNATNRTISPKLPAAALTLTNCKEIFSQAWRAYEDTIVWKMRHFC